MNASRARGLRSQSRKRAFGSAAHVIVAPVGRTLTGGLRSTKASQRSATFSLRLPTSEARREVMRRGSTVRRAHTRFVPS